MPIPGLDRLPSALRRRWRGWGAPPATPLDAGADEARFVAGRRSAADLLAPASVELASDHLRLEREYVRTLAVTRYPRTVEPGWLHPLLDLGEPLETALHLTPLESAPMVAALTHQLVQLHSSRTLDERRGRLADAERETAYDDAARLRDALQRGDERLFSAGLYAQIRAGSPEALDAATRRVERTLGAAMAQSRPAAFEHDLGFHTCLPEGDDALGVVHNLDTSSLATMFPFTASTVAMPNGILYGVAADTHAPIFVDPFGAPLDNANLAIFASSGAGKSYFTKLLLLRAMLRGVAVVAIDPEDEYRAVCAAAEGEVIRLAGASAQRLNPFDLPPGGDAEGRDPLDEHVAALIALVEVLVAEPAAPLGARERALVERAIYAAYAGAGVRRGVPATYGRSSPLLADLHAMLERDEDPAARGLAVRLERYVRGSLAGLFAGPTNVALGGRMVVFNLQGLEAELRPVGIHLITAFVWGQVRRHRRERLLVVDEAWSLLQYEHGARFLGELARRARKYGLGLVTITQDVADALAGPHGRAVLNNSDCTLLLKQNAATIGPVAEACRLSAAERQYLLGAERGSGLFFFRTIRLPIRVVASPEEDALATTAPREVAAREAHGPPRPSEPPDSAAAGEEGGV